MHAPAHPCARSKERTVDTWNLTDHAAAPTGLFTGMAACRVLHGLAGRVDGSTRARRTL